MAQYHLLQVILQDPWSLFAGVMAVRLELGMISPKVETLTYAQAQSSTPARWQRLQVRFWHCALPSCLQSGACRVRRTACPPACAKHRLRLQVSLPARGATAMTAPASPPTLQA